MGTQRGGMGLDTDVINPEAPINPQTEVRRVMKPIIVTSSDSKGKTTVFVDREDVPGGMTYKKGDDGFEYWLAQADMQDIEAVERQNQETLNTAKKLLEEKRAARK